MKYLSQDESFIQLELHEASPRATAFSTSCFRLGASQAPFHDHGVPASPPSEAAPGAPALLPLGAQGTGAEPVLHVS